MGGTAQHRRREPKRRRWLDGHQALRGHRQVQRVGGQCAICRYSPTLRDGERACPYTMLYWDFLMRHEALLAKNVACLNDAQRQAVMQRAEAILLSQVGVAA